MAADERRWAQEGLTGLGQGWAIGTRGWMQALAKERARPGLAVGLPKEERAALREACWQDALEDGLRQRGKSAEALETKPMKQDWKLALVEEVRQSTGASISWLATNLHLGGAATLRGYLHFKKNSRN